MEDKNDPLITMRAELDQAAASIKEIAPVLKSFHTSLLAQGFNPTEALELTRTFLTGTFFKG